MIGRRQPRQLQRAANRRRALLATWATAIGLGSWGYAPLPLSARDLPASTQPAAAARAEPTAPEAPLPLFVDRTADSGIDFVHRHHGTGEKYMPENMGPGLAILDVDGDDRLDIFFVQGAPLLGAPGAGAPGAGAPGAGAPRGEVPGAKDSESVDATADMGHRLYRQTADGRFEDTSSVAGIDIPGVGMGAAYGDMDGDGHLDLYISQFGRDLLLRGKGDGRFENATDAAGLGKSTWSTGATFVDGDGDGDLDLYVASYVDFALDNHKYCGSAARNLRSYCHPDVYGALPDAYYRNQGGRFEEISRQVGIEPTADGKGLGVLATDLDLDGDVDIVVANDSAANYLYLGDGKGHFEESALLAGIALNGAGAAEASMGIAAGDVDGDGRPEIFLTHLDQETNTLYTNRGAALFSDSSQTSGLGPPSLPWVGFGTVLFDADLDGDLDLAVANGHILDNIHLFTSGRSHAQPLQFFDNRGGRFVEIPNAFDSGPVVGRGLLAADLDRDGDLDLVLTQNNAGAKIFENRLLPAKESGQKASPKPGPKANPSPHSLTLRLVGTQSNPQGFGTRLELQAGQGHQRREMLAASSYLSQGPPEVVFGLGMRRHAEKLTLYWPSGRVQTIEDLEAGFLYTVREPAKGTPDAAAAAKLVDRIPYSAFSP